MKLAAGKFMLLLSWLVSLAAFPAFAQSSTVYPQATPQQCDDSTAFWPLWQAIAQEATANAPIRQPQPSPDFPLPAILAALQALPTDQSVPPPSFLDQGEEYYRAPLNYNAHDVPYWAQTEVYAQAASDYEAMNLPQAIKEFDAIVNGSSAPLYRAAAAYSAARAAFRTGDFADGATRVAAILHDSGLSEFWPETWNLIDRTRTGGDNAGLAAAELLQESWLMTTPSGQLCNGPTQTGIGLTATYGMSPAKGMPFQIFDAPDAPTLQPGIDYAIAHDKVVAAALQMYQSADVDRQNWAQSKNPLWALSLGQDGNVQDIPALDQAIAALNNSKQPAWMDERTARTLVWLLALDEANIYVKSGNLAKASAALQIPQQDINADFLIQTGTQGSEAIYTNEPPAIVTQAVDGTVNGVTKSLLDQAVTTAKATGSYDISQIPAWQTARQWAITSGETLHHPVTPTLSPALVDGISELYLNPALHLQADQTTGEIRLGVLRWILDDWSGAQLIALSRQPYVAPQDRQAMVGAAWIRAYALRDWHDVYGWLPDMRAAFPMLAPRVDAISQAWLPATKRHLALYLALSAPGLVAQPSFSRGMGNLFAYDLVADEQHTANFLAFDMWNPSDGNWWCPEGGSFHHDISGYGAGADYAASLDQRFGAHWYLEPENAQAIVLAPLGHMGDGGRELAAVRATGSSTERFADDAVAWGRHGNWLERITGGDEDLPETLHLAVQATRYACRRPPDQTPWSSAAFSLLHERFPNSMWAQKTPYWFGDVTQPPQW